MAIQIPFAIAKSAFLLLVHANRAPIDVKVGEAVHQLYVTIPDGVYGVKLEVKKNSDQVVFNLKFHEVKQLIDACAKARIYDDSIGAERFNVDIVSQDNSTLDCRIWVAREGSEIYISLESYKVNLIRFPLNTNF